MEKITVKFQKMGCDIDIEKGLNHRIRTVIQTEDKKWLFLEIGMSDRPTLTYTDCKNQKEYLERYPNENYIHVDFCFRVDIPKDKYNNFSEEYKEIQSHSFRDFEYSKENIIKFLQRFNKNIVDYELVSDFWIDDFCDKMGFFALYDTRLKHKMEPLKIISKFFDTVKIKYQYTAWNYDQSVEYTETDTIQINLSEIVETPDGRKITKKERFVEMYGIDTYNILMEEYNERLEDLRKWKKPTILQCKNKYGYTIKQLKIDYNKKTFCVGSFTIGADETITKKALNAKIEELKALNFEEVAQ